MYILRQVLGDIMVLDTVEGHGETRRRLAGFLAPKDRAIEIAAVGRCPLDPDMEALRLHKMRKTAELLHTNVPPGGILQVSGRADLLARHIDAFDFEPDVESGDHPEAFMNELAEGRAHIIIEADVDAGSA